MINLQFTSNGLPEDTFQVLELNGEEEMSHLFRFELRLVSRDPEIDFKSVLESTAFIEITTQDKTRYVHGMISEFEQAGSWHSGLYEYNAVLVPRLWMLTQSLQNQIYQKQTVPDIIQSELDNISNKGGHPLVLSGLTTADYDIHTVRNYDEREYVVQYKEPDFNFISRLMEHEGIYYYFENDDQAEKIVITDTMVQQGTDFTPVMFQAEAAVTTYSYNAVSKFSRSQKQIPGSVLVKDYNYRSPSLPIQATGDVAANGIGFVTEFGAHVKSPEEGEELANIRAEEFRCRQNIYHGESNVSYFSCGHLYTLMNHFRDDFNQDYLVTKVIHHASQAIQSWGNVGDTSYHNQFSCIPSDLPYRPQRLTPRPKMYGIMNGVIDSEQDMDRADLDEEGRYKVLMPFDISGAAPGKASRRIRMAQPYGGGGAGMSFPLVKGTEVIWTCIDGDIDRPIITGTVPNPLNKSVTTHENNTSNVIKTTSGITMSFFDGVGGAGQNASGSGDDLAQQQQNQNTASEFNTSKDTYCQIKQGVSFSPLLKFQNNSHPQSLEQQQQQTIVNNLSNYKIDLGDASTNSTPDTSTGKRFKIAVPDYGGTVIANAGSNNDSYLRLGKADLWEKLEIDLDGDGTADTRDGWMDYTDGNHLSITQGKRTDVINGGDYRQVITSGGLKTEDAAWLHFDDFRQVADGNWRRSTRGFLSADSYTHGDSEEFFAGFKFDGMVGMNTSAYLGGNLDVAVSANVDIKFGYDFSFGKVGTFEYVEGEKYTISNEEKIEARNKVELYVETSSRKDPTAKQVIAAAAAITTATAAVGGLINGLRDSGTTDRGSDVGMGVGIGAATGLYASAIVAAGMLKNSTPELESKRESQVVLEETKINMIVGKNDEPATKLEMKNDGSTKLTNILKEGSELSISAEGNIKATASTGGGTVLIDSEKNKKQFIKLNSDGKLVVSAEDAKEVKIQNGSGNQIKLTSSGIELNSSDIKMMKGTVKLGPGGALSVS